MALDLGNLSDISNVSTRDVTVTEIDQATGVESQVTRTIETGLSIPEEAYNNYTSELNNTVNQYLGVTEDIDAIIRMRLDELIAKRKKYKEEKNDGSLENTIKSARNALTSAQDAVNSVGELLKLVDRLMAIPGELVDITLPPVTHTKDHAYIGGIIDKYLFGIPQCYLNNPENLFGIQAIVDYCSEKDSGLVDKLKNLINISSGDLSGVINFINEVKEFIKEIFKFIRLAIQTMLNMVAELCKLIAEFNKQFTKKLISAIDEFMEKFNDGKQKVLKVIAGIIYRIKIIIKIYIIAITEYLIPEFINKLMDRISGIPV